MTEERVRYDELKEYTTYISTALVRKYGLQPGETVALFSPNTIWYPVAMLSTVRAGRSLAPEMEPSNDARRRDFRRFARVQRRGNDLRAQNRPGEVPHDRPVVYGSGRPRGAERGHPPGAHFPPRRAERGVH